jgi:hypothetical protein
LAFLNFPDTPLNPSPNVCWRWQTAFSCLRLRPQTPAPIGSLDLQRHLGGIFCPQRKL